MGMNNTPVSERVHIAFFGRRNAGKSSVLNAVTGQDLAVVSEIKGTTTDPVYKTMELLPLGPVVLIDTPGIDDEGELGALRVRKSYQVLNKTDTAVLVADGRIGLTAEDRALLKRIQEKEIPCLIVYNKVDLKVEDEKGAEKEPDAERESETKKESEAKNDSEVEVRMSQINGTDTSIFLNVSAKTGQGIDTLKECLARLGRQEENQRKIVGDLLEPSDIAVLVIPIDKAAPKGRLILPQQQTIRDILDADASAVMVKENELKGMLSVLGKKPKLVITDSQIFAKAAEDTPPEILLTSFSILFARYKGNLETAVRGAAALKTLRDGDKILIAEGCTHHRQCGDIGTVKLPGWIRKYTGKNPEFVFTSGTEFPDDLSSYHMIVHCGGCMLNEREMKYRLKCAKDQEIPMTNYGILIAAMQGILERSLEAFPDIAGELKGRDS